MAVNHMMQSRSGVIKGYDIITEHLSRQPLRVYQQCKKRSLCTRNVITSYKSGISLIGKQYVSFHLRSFSH